MARRGMAGQLNMFDFFSSLEDNPSGEVEMVSLMPDFDEEPEVVEAPGIVKEPEVVEVTEIVEEPEVREKVQQIREESKDNDETFDIIEKEEKAVMSRVYEIDGMRIEIAYHNYNKVRISKEGEETEWKVFDSSKEAVDYYVQQMQKYEKEK